jgi:asparaginyl-tRNA synthetase
MNKLTIRQIISEGKVSQEYDIYAWVKAFRNDRFLALNDGSCLANLQCVINPDDYDIEFLKKISIGCSVNVKGTLAESQGKGQTIEIKVENITILGQANSDDVRKTILSPKKHSLEKLREQAHLRVRTNTFGAVMRLRSKLSFAVHEYFQKNNFQYVTTPIITNSDAEGAGEAFTVTNMDLKSIPKTDDGKVDFKKDFFGKQANLTVSGQLEAETYALGLGKVYTFGPTFRAENSNTTRHLSEFWMIEPEVAFCDLEGNMDLAQDFITYVINYVLKNCKEDLQFLDDRLIKEEALLPKQQRSELSLIKKLEFVVSNQFKRVSYTEAIEILKNSKPNKKKKFEYPIEEWGADLQSEHERFLVEKHFKCPVILYDYPANIKAFYMRLNEDNKTVRAMDVLFPGIGEIVGGSQREERLDVLTEKMDKLDISQEELWWYIETRRFGTCEHSGFGLGFERLVQFVTGMNNIRDVIPYPRTPKNLDF